MGTARGYSESELRAMAQDVESDLVVGVDDAGRPTGLPITDALLPATQRA